MDDLEIRLQDELRSVATAVHPSPELDTRTPARVHQRARRRSLAFAGVGAAAVLALLVGVVAFDDDEQAEVETVDQPDGAAAPGEWAAMASAPIAARVGFVHAWTGEELLVWGGTETGLQTFDDGAAYNPDTDT